MKLRDKQRAFVDEYLLDFNGAQAAVRAGYAPRHARITAAQLLTNPNVLSELAAKRNLRAARVQITQDEVLTMLRREAEAGDLQVPNPARIRAQELLGKHLGIFSRPEHRPEHRDGGAANQHSVWRQGG